MLTIRPTKMLARRLGIAIPSALPEVTNRVTDWCVHEFRVSRHRYLIFCNTASLYPVVTFARGVTNTDSLIARLGDSLQENMSGTKLESRFQRWIAPELTTVQWAPIPGKSVLGSMNDLIFMAKYDLADHGEPLSQLSRRLAESPMSMLGMNSPDRVFPKLTV